MRPFALYWPSLLFQTAAGLTLDTTSAGKNKQACVNAGKTLTENIASVLEERSQHCCLRLIEVLSRKLHCARYKEHETYLLANVDPGRYSRTTSPTLLLVGGRWNVHDFNRLLPLHWRFNLQ
jgi:hypothetical protein